MGKCENISTTVDSVTVHFIIMYSILLLCLHRLVTHLHLSHSSFMMLSHLMCLFRVKSSTVYLLVHFAAGGEKKQTMGQTKELN